MNIDRPKLIAVLSHIRAAMLANVADAPVGPALEAAEEDMMRLLFTGDAVQEYLNSPGSRVYRRQ